jgi:urease accessory protein
MRAFLATLALMFCADAAVAHNVVPGVGGFAGGLLHPLLVPTHVIAIAGLGLLAGQQVAAMRRWLLAMFAAGLLMGIFAIVLAFATEAAELVLLLCAAVAGLLTATARPTPVLLAAPLVAVAGAALELDSVPDEISMQATMLALVGTAMGALLALVVVAAISADRTRQWQRIGVRVLGSWIAASAILVLALRLTR